MVFLVILGEIMAVDISAHQSEIACHQDGNKRHLTGLESGPMSKQGFHKKYTR